LTIAFRGLKVKVMGQANAVGPTSIDGGHFFKFSVVDITQYTVRASVQCIVKNDGWDPDVLWHGRLEGSRDDAGTGVWGSVQGN